MSKKALTDKQKLDILVPKVMSTLCDIAEQRMPEKGIFQKFFVTFEYPGTKYEGMLWVEPNLTGQDGNGRITAAMRHSGSDRVVQHYMAAGNKAEIMAWLMCSGNVELLQADYEQLKQASDRFD